MTHSTVDYKGKTAEEALKDLCEWLGSDRYERISKEFKAYSVEQMPYETFAGYMSLIQGVTGYPIKCFYESIYEVSLDQAQEVGNAG